MIKFCPLVSCVCVRERMDLFMMMIFVARWIISRWLEISILTFGPIVLLCVWRRRKEGTRYSITTAERCYPPRTEREKKEDRRPSAGCEYKSKRPGGIGSSVSALP